MSETRQEGGWVRHYRRLWNDPAFLSKQHAAVWAWMIATAAWKTTTVRFDGNNVTLERGQLIVGQRRVAEDFGLSRAATRRLMSVLEAAQMVALRSAHGGTVVSIVNYDLYQPSSDPSNFVTGPSSEPSGGPSAARERPASGPPYKEEKEIEEGKEEYGELKLTAPPVAEPVDLKKLAFDLVVALMRSKGIDKEDARKMVGRWLASYSPDQIVEAANAAIREDVIEPKSWITAALAARGQGRNGRAQRGSPIVRQPDMSEMRAKYRMNGGQ